MFPYLKQALSNLFMKPSTIAFPAGDPPKAKENYRGRIAFNEKTCINCGMCERVCAPASITRKATKLENGDLLRPDQLHLLRHLRRLLRNQVHYPDRRLYDGRHHAGGLHGSGNVH